MKIDGIEVHDARRPLYLNITKTHAASGQKDPGNCAAAKAALTLPGVIEARIYRARSYLLRKNRKGQKHWERFTTPHSIRSEMISFDRGSYFDPGEYTLNPPGESAKLGAVYVRKSKHGSTGIKKPRHKPHVVKGIREVGPRGWFGRAKK